MTISPTNRCRRDANGIARTLEINALGAHGPTHYGPVKVKRIRERYVWTINGNRSAKADCINWIERDLEISSRAALTA